MSVKMLIDYLVGALRICSPTNRFLAKENPMHKHEVFRVRFVEP